jgi:site-specific recombinase XerD
MDPWDAAISLYLKAQRQAGLSKSTVGYYDARPLTEQGCSELGKYGWHLRELAQWARRQGVSQPEEVSRNALLEWGAYKAERWQKTTQRQAVFAYRSFFGWLVEEGRIEHNPALVLKAPNAKKAKVRRTLTREEIELLFIACRSSEPDAVRNLALISLMIDTGLRSSETCSLKISSLHFNETRPGFSEPFNFLTVHIKGGDERVAYFSDTTAFRLTRWIDLRKMFVRGNGDGLFVSIGGNRPGRNITPSGLRVIFRKLAKRAGIRHFSPHALRRSMTVLAIQAGANTRVVQEMGRWSDIKMVEHYSKAFQVGPVFKKFSPVNFVSSRTQTDKEADTSDPMDIEEPATYTFSVDLPADWQ